MAQVAVQDSYEPAQGTWRLTAVDPAGGGDLGALIEWCLAPTLSLPIGIFSDGFESGDTSAWSGVSPLLP